ncbi:CRISPR-associated protein Csx3 [Streptomyces sp. N35]
MKSVSSPVVSTPRGVIVFVRLPTWSYAYLVVR